MNPILESLFIDLPNIWQIITWVISIGVGAVAFKFFKTHKHYNLEEQKLINRVQEELRMELAKEKTALFNEIHEYRKEVKKVSEENLKLREERIEHRAVIEHLKAQVDILSKEIINLRKRLARQLKKKICDKCETPKECNFGLDCLYSNE